MEAPSPTSFVSRARSALHTAAAKAERVLTDIKSDLKSSDRDCGKRYPASFLNLSDDDSPRESEGSHETKQLKWKPPPISLGTKQEWQERLRNIRIGRKGVDEAEKDGDLKMTMPIYDEALCLVHEKNHTESKVSDTMSTLEGLLCGNIEKIPPLCVVRQLAVAILSCQKQNSMKDFLVSPRDPSPVKERGGLSLSAVRSLVLREKEDKERSDFGDDENVISLMKALFDAEGDFLSRKSGSKWDETSALDLSRDIHAAPLGSFVVKVAEVIGSFKSMKKMALFWCRVVEQLQRLWLEEQHIAGIPQDEVPDLKSCLLYQQLQVINCCVTRKRRHSIAKESLDTTIRKFSPSRDGESVHNDNNSATCALYARISTGDLVLRLGADHPSDDLYMLETGEPIYSPVTQECPLLTEDLIKETEEFVLRTGSVGAGCSQLLSDMQAFKAANPGCILEDFVRWHSPPDWTEAECCQTDSYDSVSLKGQLSIRMQKEGNLWRELWEAAKPVPAVNQSPLFDEDLAVEGILNFLEDIPPSNLFEQLFVSLLGVGLGIAESSLSADCYLSKLFFECKEFVIATCQGSISEKANDLCQVYETVEMMLLKPEEVLKMIKQAEDTVTTPVSGEPKNRFKRLIPNFGGKDKSSKDEEAKVDHQKSPDDSLTRQSFASFFNNKSSLFSKKPPKPLGPSSAAPDDNEWTLV